MVSSTGPARTFSLIGQKKTPTMSGHGFIPAKGEPVGLVCTASVRLSGWKIFHSLTLFLPHLLKNSVFRICGCMAILEMLHSLLQRGIFWIRNGIPTMDQDPHLDTSHWAF